MFKKNDDKDPRLDEAIGEALESLNPYDDDYVKKVEAVERLYKLKEVNNPRSVSPDTIAIVLGNLLGVILIVSHERTHVLTSKALSFVQKLR